MNLFQLGTFNLHGGEESDFKIECDALTQDDWKCLARLVDRIVPIDYHTVLGVPMGGFPLADALKEYTDPAADGVLIVDDVLTTGSSIEMECQRHDSHADYVIGVVVFARRKCPDWVIPLFQMHPAAE